MNSKFESLSKKKNEDYKNAALFVNVTDFSNSRR